LRYPIVPAVIAAIIAAGIAAAQPAAPTAQGGPAMSQDTGGKEPPPSPATRAYMDAALAMHRDMAVAYRNDADRDFAATLEAHHKGAVDIAKVELQYGTDPEMRRLAEAVIRARDSEIALIQAWRAKHP
jgi:uncharacterized protein (DUF305 family)